MRARTSAESSCSRTATSRRSTASPASSAAPRAFFPPSPTRRRRGPATTATSSAGATSRRTSSRNRFAFMVSKRQAEAFRARLAAGKRSCSRRASTRRWSRRPTTSSWRRSPAPTRPRARSSSTAHLCHQSAGANDNASGSAAILEVGRALAARDPARDAAAAETDDPVPLASRDLGLAGLSRPPSRARVAHRGRRPHGHGRRPARDDEGRPSTSRARPSRCPTSSTRSPRPGSPRSRSASLRYAEGAAATPTPASSGRRARASRSSATCAGLEMGSDHEVFEAAGFGIPMVYFHDWPDVTIHTQKDLPENLDATKLGRVAYMGAGSPGPSRPCPTRRRRPCSP